MTSGDLDQRLDALERLLLSLCGKIFEEKLQTKLNEMMQLVIDIRTIKNLNASRSEIFSAEPRKRTDSAYHMNAAKKNTNCFAQHGQN